MIFPFRSNLDGHVVEPLLTPSRTREHHIGDRTGNTSIATFKRMDCHEPHMYHTGFKNKVGRTLFFKLVEELFHHHF